MKKLIYSLFAAFAALAMTSCESGNPEFDDFEYQTVYFATQYPVRTVELGKDQEVDLTLDNQHKVRVTATMGGSYGNKRDITVKIAVDPTLCEGLSFDNGTPIEVLPSTYYKLASDQIVIPAGSILGGVEVELTDDFFADAKSLDKNYVLPIRMTSIVSGADSILENRDFVLYAIKYVNPYHAYYLRRGVDNVNIDGANSTVVRRKEYIEYDESVSMSSLSLTGNSLPLFFKDEAGIDQTVVLNLNFGNDGSCTVTSGTAGVEVNGSGKFVENGEKKAISNQDRDVIYLDYNVKLNDKVSYATKDTLVLQARGIAPETFTLK